MREKGQSSIEVLAIAVVLLGLFLATTTVLVSRNIETSIISQAQRNMLQCSSLSGLITKFNATDAYSEKKMPDLEQAVRIEKGSIIVGDISCRYSGLAYLQARGETFPGDYDSDRTGVDPGFDLGEPPLALGNTYKMKKTNIGVVFCDSSETWC